MSASFGEFMGLLSGIRVMGSPYAYASEPVKKHKHRPNQSAAYHRRVQKKWAKRFGTKQVPCAYMINGTALGLGFNGIVVSPEMAKSLEDDGDALRLAVKLGVAVELHPAWVYARAVMPNDHMKWTEIVEGWGKTGEPYAATRRAIVRAAAEIGKLAPSAPSTDGGGT